MKLRKGIGLATGPMLAFTALLLCLCGFAPKANTQTTTTTEIRGTVTDSSGAVVAGARVELKNQDTGAKLDTATNPSGEYAFFGVRPGTYTVTVSFQGFQTAQVTDRTVAPAVPALVDVILQVGQTAQTVTVSAKGADLVNTSTAEVAGTLNTTLIATLPVSSRNFLALATLTPGTAPEDTLGTWTNNGSLQVSTQQGVIGWNPVGSTSQVAGIIAGGNRAEAGSVSIDGSNVQSSNAQAVTQMQDPASIEEVKVESGIMNPEFGYGAFAVNVTTKGGSNSLHGEAYEFLRNNALDANFVTNIESNRELPPYRRNEFGAAVGGPVIKNKLHFFADYSGLRAWQGVVEQSLVPPASMRNGDMNNTGTYDSSGNPVPGPQVYNPYQVDPVTGQRAPFPNNIIPMGSTTLCSPRPTCIDPVSAAMLKYTPLPNAIINNLSTYVGVNVTKIQQDQGTGRLDWDKSTNSRIYGRFTDFRNYNIRTGSMSLQGLANPFSSKNVAASWTRSLGPASVNELWASYTRPQVFVGRDTAAGDVAKEIGLKNTSGLGGSPNLQVPGYQLAFSFLNYGGFVENTYQLKDQFSRIWGSHSIKMGFQALQRRYDNIGQNGDKGAFIWSPLYSTACPAGNTTCTDAIPAANQGGQGFADFLLGTAAQERLSLTGSDTHTNMSYYGGFAQDSWRATRKLTVNYGLRYEYWSPWLNPRNNVVAYNKATATLTYALANPLDFYSPATHFGRDAKLTPGVPRTLYTTGKKDFAPRLGLAYLLTPNTAIRAGTGIFFDGSSGINAPLGGGIGPFGYTISNVATGNEPVPPYLFSEAFPAPVTTGPVGPSLTNPQSFDVMDISSPYKTPTIYEWSFSVQRSFGNAWGLEVTYFGLHNIRLPQAEAYNPADPPLGSKADLSVQERRLYPQWGQLTGSVNRGWAKYHAMTTTLRANYWHGLTMLSSFTWSKDKVTAHYGIGNQGFMDFRDLYRWAGPSLINPNLRSVTSWTYELPFGRGKQFNFTGPADWVAGGWRVSAIAQFMQGGHQWFLAQDNSGTSIPSFYGMADLVCNPNNQSHSQPRLAYINPACFQTPPFGSFGNATLGSFTEPGINNWDLAAAKSFRVPVPKLEDSQLNFRADFFNAFNHTQWSYVCNQFNCRVPGRANGTHNPRQIQFMLQYVF